MRRGTIFAGTTTKPQGSRSIVLIQRYLFRVGYLTKAMGSFPFFFFLVIFLRLDEARMHLLSDLDACYDRGVTSFLLTLSLNLGA